MALVGIDIGTTHLKAGLFEDNGNLIHLSIQKNRSYQDEYGNSYYDPEEMWKKVMQAIEEVTRGQQVKVAAIGITSMAESGLLIDQQTGHCRSMVIPWFDRRTENTAQFIQNELDPVEHFKKTGIRNNYKHGLAKLLWLKQDNPDLLANGKWLSTSDYIAYKLTGEIGTDYSLAARTFAFRIDKKQWDKDWIEHFGLSPSLFPEARASGMKVGEINSDYFKRIGLDKGVPVAVSGHDHVCAALAVGAVKIGVVSDSIGTAETLVGCLNERVLTTEDYQSGFNFGAHVVPNRFFWMGAIQSSGGSVEWIRNQLSSQSLSYDQINTLLENTPKEPTGILYYPYLAGSGSPKADPKAKGAFIGLTASHQQGDLLRGLLEGTAFEFEYMRKTIELLNIARISKLIATGGGTKNKQWMQIKADVSNCSITIPPVAEATLLGAALVAGLGCGMYSDEEEVIQLINESDNIQVHPNSTNHQKYNRLFNEGYLPLQQPLRAFYQKEW